MNGQIKLGTNAIIDTSLTADPAAEFLGPYDENGAGIEVVIICRTCFVPPAYVHLPLAKPLSPRVLCTLANYSRSYPGRRTGTIILTFDRLPLRSHYKVTDKIVAYHVHCLAPTSYLMNNSREILEHDYSLLKSSYRAIQRNQIATIAMAKNLLK